MAPPPLKQLVVCADDFGMSRSINKAVLQLADQGRLNATSCLVHAEAFREDATSLGQSGIQTGLHLNFTEKLAADQGVSMPVSQLIAACWSRRLSFEIACSQIRQQLQCFYDVMGRLPQFIDGHQHVHQFPVIRAALFQVLPQFYGSSTDKLWLRSTIAASMHGVPGSQRFKAYIIQALGANAFAREASRHGYTVNSGFLGVYNFQGGRYGYQALMQAWLGNAEAGQVLMCHPSASIESADVLSQQRVHEFDVLGSDWFGQALLANGLSLA